MELLLIISTFPLIFYLIDGYYQKDMKRGFHQIIAFIVTGLVLIFVIKVMGLISVLFLPIAILVYVLIARKKVE